MTARFVECSNIPVRLAAVALLFLAGTTLHAQVPQLINYQGRVAVGSVNFDGDGQFKFALVDAGGTTSYWSNDGTSTAGSEPAVAVTLTVSDGSYSVLLGDATLPNMAAIPQGVLDNSDLFLRVWFNDGANGSQQLTPDQRIATTAPGNVPGIRGGNPPAPPEAWQQRGSEPAPVRRFDHTAVWTGSEMIVWGGGISVDGVFRSLNDGGRYDLASNSWTAVTTAGAPAARRYHTAVWTGSEMIVWGGQTFSLARTGGRYNPTTNSWTALSTTSAFAGGTLHKAVWTGSEMIVWGGHQSSGDSNEGGRYNPAGNSWTAMTTTGAPAERHNHAAIWTGSEMVVWGGSYFDRDGVSHYLNDGGRYNPAENSWTAVNTIGAPAGRSLYTAVWTGSEMIVWGGFIFGVSGQLNDGGRYNPADNSWTAVSTTGGPRGRSSHTAIWTGSEMIIWGGQNSSYGWLNDGGRYNPAENSWTAVSTTGGPRARSYHTAVWTGSEMIVWGGKYYLLGSEQYLNDGGRYNPADDSWTALTTEAPAARTDHATVWTGSEMIVWGGQGGGYFNDGGRYNPTANSWMAVTNNGAPAARNHHTAVWTGIELVVWGGADSNASVLSDGGRYSPALNSWSSVNPTGAPGARGWHTAVWTGTHMIVWGGVGNGYLNDGGRYNPTGNSWTPMTTNGAPGGRYLHTAVWTGNEMIVWGGYHYGGGDQYWNTGGRYSPLADGWTAVNTIGAPAARTDHTAVWTGSEMLVWGGYDGSSDLNTGGRYDPLADSWKTMNTTGAPAARTDHTAVWTGNEMIIWGGYDGSNNLNSGGRYHPADNNWTAMTTTGGPVARNDHSSVWTGSEMIVWGGSGSSGYFNDTFSYFPDTGLFDFTSVARSAGNLTLSFRTFPGRTYSLWQSDSLATGSWTDSGLLALPGNGATLSFTVPNSASTRRFFRIQANQ